MSALKLKVRDIVVPVKHEGWCGGDWSNVVAVFAGPENSSYRFNIMVGKPKEWPYSYFLLGVEGLSNGIKLIKRRHE